MTKKLDAKARRALRAHLAESRLEKEMPPTPHGFKDSTLVMTKLHSPPHTTDVVMEGDAQIIRIAVQAFGRRVAKRLMVEIMISDAIGPDFGWLTMGKFPAWSFLGHGYSTTQIDPEVVGAGHIVRVKTELYSASRWWERLVDRITDWWTPPKVRVLVTGVMRKPEVEA